MRPKTLLLATLASFLLLGAISAYQLPFRQYPGREYSEFALPPDWQDKGEWAFARLMYPATYRAFGGGRGRGRRGFDDWTQGRSSWTTDYPRSDRHVSQALRRLTRIQVRSVEQPINLDDGPDVYNWPWLYAVEVGHWELSKEQVARMRDFLLRGGFFMCDDFHGTAEWEVFTDSMNQVFPDRQIVDIPDNDPIFHTIYDLDNRYQVPGAQYLRSGVTYENYGTIPRWRGIYDDKGRLMVAICHNMDLGDSWEWADDPSYDEKFSAMGIRIAVNYVTYSMTH